MNSPKAYIFILLFLVLSITAFTADEVEENSSRQATASHYSDYETFVNPEANTSISVGMSKDELERVLGTPLKTSKPGDDGGYTSRYGGIAVYYRSNKALTVTVETAAVGYITKQGRIAIGDPIEEVRRQFGPESMFVKGYNDLTYSLIVHGDKVSTMKLPMQSFDEARAQLKDAENYWLEFRMDDDNLVSQISLIAKEVYLPEEVLQTDP